MKRTSSLDKSMAALWKREAKKQYKYYCRQFPKDRRMLDVFKNDLTNHQDAANALAANDIIRSKRIANNMDTLPRDQIPDSVWQYLYPWEYK